MQFPNQSSRNFLDNLGRDFPQKEVEVIHGEGTADERRLQMRAIIQSTSGQFNHDAQIYEGDVVELPDPRGGTRRLLVDRVNITDAEEMSHISVKWADSCRSPFTVHTSNVYHGPVVTISGNGAQLAWGNNAAMQAQQVEPVVEGYEDLAAIVAKMIQYARSSRMDSEEKLILQETADDVLHEVVKSSPDRLILKRGLAILRGLNKSLLFNLEKDQSLVDQATLRDTLSSLQHLTLPQ